MYLIVSPSVAGPRFGLLPFRLKAASNPAAWERFHACRSDDDSPEHAARRELELALELLWKTLRSPSRVR